MSYIIDCSFCNKKHRPVWGNKRPVMAASVGDPIAFPYICPNTEKKGEVTFPYDDQIANHSIIGWENVDRS